MAKAIIHKAKLKKGVTLVVEYTENRPDGSVFINQTCSADVHADLLDAFNALSPHLAELCDQYDRSGVLSDRISFRGFTIKGEDDKEGVVLTGLRTVANNKSITLNSPFQRFGNEGEDVGYEKVEDLLAAVEKAKSEVLAYLYEGKHAPNPQGSLFDKQGEDDVDDNDGDDD